MPIFQGNALLVATSGLSEATRAFLPASLPIDAGSIADNLAKKANDLAQKAMQAVKQPKRLVSNSLSSKRTAKISPEDIQRGRDIKLQELCWMCPPPKEGRDTNFAHICILLSKSQSFGPGSKYTECVCPSITPLISGETKGRSKVLICDSDHGDTLWISKKQTALLYPFKSSSNDQTNFTEKFLKREGEFNTQAFQEALKLAEMHLDESNTHRVEALKLLHLGALQRRELVSRHHLFQQYKQSCEEISTQQRENRAPFFAFHAERCAEMKATDSSISDKDITPEISKQWRKLSYARKTECPPLFTIPIHSHWH